MKRVFFVLEEGLLQKSVFEIEGTMNIGRSLRNPIQLSGLDVSRVHARITYDGKTCTLEDLQSTNGTFVEGRRIKKATLQNRMKVQFGSAELRYLVEEEEEKTLEILDDTAELSPPEEKKDRSNHTTIRLRSKRLEETILKIPVFEGLSAMERQKLVEQANLHICPEGKVIVREGNPGRSLYIVLDGQVKVFTSDYKGTRIVLETLGHDQVFGEIGMLSGAPRTISVVAAEESFLAEFSFKTMKEILRRYPSIRKGFEEVAQMHLHDIASKKMKTGIKERRLDPRLNQELLVKFAVLSNPRIEKAITEKVYSGMSKDISLTGIRLQVNDPSLQMLPLETRLKMEIKLPEKHGKISVLGAIKSRFHNEEQRLTFLSIQFIKHSATGMIRLKEFIYR